MSPYKTFILASIFSFVVAGAWIAHAPSVGAEEKELEPPKAPATIEKPPEPVVAPKAPETTTNPATTKVPVPIGPGGPGATIPKECTIGKYCNQSYVSSCLDANTEEDGSSCWKSDGSYSQSVSCTQGVTACETAGGRGCTVVCK